MFSPLLISRILPENVATLSSHHETKEKVLSYSDASDVLRYAFTMTEAAIDHEYEVGSPFLWIFLFYGLKLPK
jgi:hypothetical protein